MEKCIVLVGNTASGKTTLSHYLESRGYRRILTYTTRPMRKGEVNGVDYHFLSTEDFEKKLIDGFFAEFTFYNAEFGSCYYGSAVEDYRAVGNTVIVVNPIGVISLTEPAYIVWLDIPEDIIISRALSRGDSEDEVRRRIRDDKIYFDNFEKFRLYNLRIIDVLPVDYITEMIEKDIL